MTFAEFQTLSRLFVIGALDPEEELEFENSCQRFGRTGDNFVHTCYALHDSFRLSLQPVHVSLAMRSRLVEMVAARKAILINKRTGRVTTPFTRRRNMLAGKQSRILAFEGEIDLHVLPRISSALTELIQERPGELVVDLSRVTYIDSSGLGALITGMRDVEGYGGTFALAGLQENVQSIFETARLDQVFRIFPDAQTALDAPWNQRARSLKPSKCTSNNLRDKIDRAVEGPLHKIQKVLSIRKYDD